MQEEKITQRERELIQELYAHICECEDIRPIPLKFRRTTSGTAGCIIVRSNRDTPPWAFEIHIDLKKNSNGETTGVYVTLCHEVAHQIQITRDKISGHDLAFQQLERMLFYKYRSCDMARELLFLDRLRYKNRRQTLHNQISQIRKDCCNRQSKKDLLLHIKAVRTKVFSSSQVGFRDKLKKNYQIFAKIDKGIAEYKAGKTKTLSSKEEVHNFLNSL